MTEEAFDFILDLTFDVVFDRIVLIFGIFDGTMDIVKLVFDVAKDIRLSFSFSLIVVIIVLLGIIQEVETFNGQLLATHAVVENARSKLVGALVHLLRSTHLQNAEFLCLLLEEPLTLLFWWLPSNDHRFAPEVLMTWNLTCPMIDELTIISLISVHIPTETTDT